jgi:hypothetical protein
MKTGLIVFAFLIVTFWGCKSHNPSEQDKQVDFSSSLMHLSRNQLKGLGIIVNDTAIVYNNKVEGVGSLDLIISDKTYIGNSANTEQTNFPFYPRYITTLDTIQRTMYMLSGAQAHSEEEAQRWESFENLVPIVVEQKAGDKEFGETLIFWMTKTPELEKLLTSF